MPLTRNRRGLRSFLGTILLGLLAGYLVVSEIRFGMRAMSARAVVKDFDVNKWRIYQSRVFYKIDGRLTDASLATWFHPVTVNEQVAILYAPTAPGEVVLDSFWERHFLSAFALVFCGIVAFGETSAFLSRCRREASVLWRD